MPISLAQPLGTAVDNTTGLSDLQAKVCTANPKPCMDSLT